MLSLRRGNLLHRFKGMSVTINTFQSLNTIPVTATVGDFLCGCLTMTKQGTIVWWWTSWSCE